MKGICNMAKSRTQKAALNTATAALSEVVLLVCGLILPRLILANYGSAYNGITSSAKQFLSAISILNVGVAGSTRVALYKTLAEDNIDESSAIVRATEIYMRKVGMILAAYIIVLAVVYPLIVDTGYDWIDVALLIIAAGIGTFGQYFFGTAYQAFLSANQTVYISNLFMIMATILNTLVSAILIYAGFSIQVVKLGSAGVLFLRPLLQNIYVTKKYKINKKCKPNTKALSQRRDVMAHSIANIVHDNTDIVVLTLFTDVKIVSVYTVYNLVMNALKKMQQVFTTGTEAVFGNMWAKGELDKIRLSLGYYEYIVTSFISIVFSTCFAMILPFVALYVHGVNDVEYVLPIYALIITSAQAIFCYRAPYVTLVQGVGHYKQTKKGAYLEAIINLSTSVLLVNIIGIAGVAVGTLLANIFRSFQYAFYIDNNLIKRGKHVCLCKLAWSIMNCIIIVLSTSALVDKYAYKGWIEWIVSAIAIVIFSLFITGISSMAFYRKDMIGVYHIAQRAFLKKRNK